MKKLLLMVVDAMASRVVMPSMRNEDLPTLQALAEAGYVNWNSVAVFPSLTPAATSSIITGQYPGAHGVLGFHWYDAQADKVIYYGDDFWIIWRKGFANFFKDFLYDLNHRYLNGDTLFQTVEEAGLEAACLNYIIYRGAVKHKVTVPSLFNLLPGVKSSMEVYGPSITYFGDFIDSKVKRKRLLERSGGLFHRFGFDDENTFKLLRQLADDRSLPDFTVAYFPDNDFESHRVGPKDAVSTLQQFDARLNELIEICGGLGKFLSEVCVVITGDHAQTDMLSDQEKARIELDSLLDGFKLAEAGKSWAEDDELILCPAMRSAQIYFKNINAKLIEHVAALLCADSRVDQVIWSARFFDGSAGYYVNTIDRGRLHFWSGDDGANSAVDHYGNHWSWDGDLDTLDATIADNCLTFADYPNAFERIAGGLNSKNSGHLWATARPGHEFCVSETNVHAGGGSHGSLHRRDSLSPLFVAGAPARVTLPDHPRSIDIAPLCLDVLGLTLPYPLDAGRF